MLRSPIRKALPVSTLSLVALAAVAGSAGAQPGPDDNPDYRDPLWRYANPAAEVADVSTETELVAQDGVDASTEAALPAEDGALQPAPRDPAPGGDPYPIEQERSAGGR